MKHLKLLSILLLLCLNSRIATGETLTSDNYVTEVFKGVNIEMPNYREINSGAKFVVTYDDNCPAELQGAFEYAVKLWEEVLPLVAPVKINVSCLPLRGTNNLISKVLLTADDYEGERVDMYKCPTTMVKSVLLQEYHRGQFNRFYTQLGDLSCLNETDITITYNQNMMDLCSFSLDGDANINKYDFVTVAMRDIAIGLGFFSDFTANVKDKVLVNRGPVKFIPFKSHIFDALGTTDLKVAYTNATKGSVKVSLRNWLDHQFETLSLYAPQNWVNGLSLRYFIPETGKPISQLLTYDFGKGYVFRDLTANNWDDIFCGALDWRKEVVTGLGGGSVSQIGSTDDKLPYTGQVSLSFNSKDKAMFLQKEDKEVKSATKFNSNTPQSTQNLNLLSIEQYCKQYDLFSPNGPVDGCISLSVLKKDGSWDCIYITEDSEQPITVNIENISLTYPETEYARGTTGGLRYRLTKCTSNYGASQPNYSYRVKYFTRDFTPQQAKIKYTKELSSLESARTIGDDNDDYFVDVKVGIANIEGTTKVIVEQLDEGESLPFQYDAEDFRNGYFIANLDREVSTKLTVISYNENGFKRSNTITIPPVGYQVKDITFKKTGDQIILDGIPSKSLEYGEWSYSINNLTNESALVNSHKLDNKTIEVSDIPSGIYVLTLHDHNSNVSHFKFVK